MKAIWKRDMCFGEDVETRYIHDDIGFNYRMTNLQAAIGVAQMKHFDEAVSAKIEIARLYGLRLNGVTGLTLPPETPWGRNVFWTYGVTVDEKFGVSRAHLQQLLHKSGIDSRRFFTPVHLQPFLAKNGAVVTRNKFERSPILAEQGICLPSYIGMKVESIEKVVEVIRKAEHHSTTRA